MTVWDTYPLPRTDDYIDSLERAAIFSTVHCTSTIWQTGISKANRDRTIISSHHGFFPCIRTPLGLDIAPASLRRAVDIPLSAVGWRLALAYFENNTAYSKSVTERPGYVRIVPALLPIAGIALKLSKCSFSDSTASSLEHTI